MTAAASLTHEHDPYPTASPARSTPVVLVAQEDELERRFLADSLTADGYMVRVADRREKALAVLATVPPVDLAVIDVNGETLELIDAVRGGEGLAGRVDPNVPIVVLTSRVEELDRIRLLDRGSDDVLAKPYSYPELRSRIAALLRRVQARRAPRMLRVGTLSIDLPARTVRVGVVPVALTGTEYRLLRTLAGDPGRVFTRQELLQSIWGIASCSSRTVDTHLHRLRRKLTAAGGDTQIEGVWGVGYRLHPPELTGGPSR